MPKFTTANGWKLQIGQSGLIMINDIIFKNNRFYVEDIEISTKEVLEEVIASIEARYYKDFKIRFEEYASKRSEEQKQRVARRRQKDKAYLDTISSKIDPKRFNIYNWSPAVPRQKLQRLYESDAKGILNNELLEDVGYTIYARCLQSRDERRLIDTGKLKCHNCGSILSYNSGLMCCPCGYQYIFKDYMKSFRRCNMPTGGAAHIFNEFIEKWPLAKDSVEKMRLIDWLIHEFHINIRSGVKGRPVGINLIQGTKVQVAQLILSLAYGNGVSAEKNREYWLANI
jgi:hypothetical protein